MPPAAAPDRTRDRTHALLVVCVLAAASLVIAFLGASPARVSATELLGDPRTPGEAAFIASHRGGGATAPENTLPAIAAALAGGFGYVEVDIALTVDGHPVLEACDPGAELDLELTGRSESSLYLPNLWGYLVADASSAVGPEEARCYAQTVIERLGRYDESEAALRKAVG